METKMRNILTLALLGVAAATLTGCPSAPVKPETKVETRDFKTPEQTDQNQGAAVQPNNGVAGSELGGDNLLKTGELAKRSIYFDYDKYDIQDKFKPIVEAHARFLSTHPDRKMLIQGNTDERGSREYNLALGQRRADAAKRALTLLGAKEGQIEAVSLGEEKPRALGKDEASYAENRRDDMLYNGEL
jgi:peptidoglycan-associated lipoprotein